MTGPFVCPSCLVEKPFDRAPKRMREGLRSLERCLDCEAVAQKRARQERGDEINQKRRANWHRHRAHQKDQSLRSLYGIGMPEWEAMFERQGRSCAICLIDEPKGRGWQTDHNHKTGAVRAILCHHCNSLLGHARESAEILSAAIQYLEAHGSAADGAAPINPTI